MSDKTSTDGTEGSARAESKPVPGQLPKHEAGEPSMIGRYEVVRSIGSGGMGVVFEAVDPSLNRRVALKLVQVSKAPQRRQGRLRKRLLREAHALAQLNHPNVVTIFEFGRHEDDVFIALEYVNGRTAADWVIEEEPSVDEILAVYLAAGEGLAAAHRAGILHRDFKPQNIIVGTDGRVRVIDFGLARFEATEPTPEELESLASASAGGAESNFDAFIGASTGASPDSPHPAVIDAITRRGALLGTPRYMSPEQQLLVPADARSDQYSFCASLYEALSGVPPHYRGGWESPIESEMQRPFREPLRKVKIPQWLLNVLHKGAHPAPQHRYPSVDALLADLRRSPKRRLSRWPVLLAATALASTALWGVSRAGQTPLARCASGAERGAQVWSPSISTKLQHRLLASRSVRAQEVWALVQDRVAGFESQWKDVYAEACDDTFVRGVQTETGLDAKLQCLVGQARRTRGLLSSAATVSTIASASLLNALPTSLAEVATIDECGDPNEFAHAPKEPAARARFDQLAGDIELLRDQTRLRESRATVDEAQALVAKAQSSAFEGLEAEAMMLVAQFKSDGGDYEAAFGVLNSVADRAARLNRVDLLVDSLTRLVSVEGYALERYEPALSRFRAVRAMLPLLQVSDRKRASLEMMGAVVYQRKGDLTQALTHFEASRRLLESMRTPPTSDLMKLYNNLGTLLRRQGDLDQASTYLYKALEMAKASSGERHPTVASILNNVANLEGSRRNFEAQSKLMEESESVARAAFGESHPSYVWIKYNVASTLVGQGREAEALKMMPTLRDQFERALGSEHHGVAQVDMLWALAARSAGDLDHAMMRYTRSIEHMRAHEHVETLDMGRALVGRALTAWVLERIDDARRDTVDARTLQTRLNLLPDEDEAWLFLSEAHMAFSSGARVRAGELLGRACNEDPHDGQDVLTKACAQLRAQLGDDSLGTLPQRPHE